MKIVLLGYMGSGKTTIGERLARSLGLHFLDLDEYIASREKRSISKIFETKGEIYFRKKEYKYLNEVLADNDHFILSTGGGTPCYGENMNAILEHTCNVFYLKLSIGSLADRLSKEKEQRPLIKSIEDHELPEFIGKHLFERSYFYAQAHHTILCDDKSIADIQKEIESALV